MTKVLDVPPLGGNDATPERRQAAEKQMESDSSIMRLSNKLVQEMYKAAAQRDSQES